ncbi:MAG: DinB family protein [Gemmatimonadota bacterium]|nr:DinB family protein [Gemmatimonadota bacterium]
MNQLITSSPNTTHAINRRSFLQCSAAFGCSIASASLFTSSAAAGPAALTAETGPNIIGPREGFSPQIGTLVSMLEWMRRAVLEPVQGLTMAELDYLHDEKANTIGALLLHLAATERHYQLHTFEGKKWDHWDENTRKQWDVPGGLGAEARRVIKGHELGYYLDALAQGREHTLAEFRKRDDTWLMQIDHDWPWGPTNNYCKWFHVCEHESNHNGQVKWIKSRLPAAKQTNGQ